MTALAKEGWILNPQGCGYRAELERAIGEIGESLRVVVDTYGTEIQLRMIASRRNYHDVRTRRCGQCFLGHPQPRFLVERANRLGCPLTAVDGTPRLVCGACVHRLLAGSHRRLRIASRAPGAFTSHCLVN